MARESASRLKQLLEQAQPLPPAERAQYLLGACGGDDELRREVESLAAAGDAADGFLQSPAVADAARLSATSSTVTPWGRPRLAARLAQGTLINGRYFVEDLAGEGGMGAVYRVRDTARSRTLALKVISGETPLVDLFKIEFRTLAGLRHPHLAQSHDFEAIVGTPDYCFTMDYIEGRNVLAATDGVPWTAIVDVLVQLCRALAYVHSRGLVHRDLKPGNVLMTGDGTVKLVDFGLVGGAHDSGRAMGTPGYLAPERFDGAPGDHRSDLYSLGVLTHQLLTRQRPWGGAEAWPADRHIPLWLREIVLRLCAPNPADRLRSGNEVIETINRASGQRHPLETLATRESYVVSARFIGRDDELATMRAHVGRRLGDAGEYAPPLLLVGGQSGVGKTRLINELRQQLQVEHYRFVDGHCFEGAASEFGAFAEAIVQLVSLVDASGGSALVERHVSELAKIAPEVGRGRSVAPSSSLISPEAEQRRMLDSAATFMIDAADLSPYVLSLDDLQWAPHGTVELLQYLMRRITMRHGEGRGVPVTIVGSYRDDEIAGRPIEQLVRPGRPDVTTVSLRPLESASMQRLLCSMFGIDEIPGSFVTRVLDEAGGSPFFLEEVVRALVENGSVFVQDGAWRTATAVHDLEIPVSIAAAVRRRLESVTDHGQRRLLHMMAAHKKPMTVSLLAAITGDSMEATQTALHYLAARHIVSPQPGAVPAYRTAHDQVRSIAYADLGTRAAAIHGQIARALETMADAGDRPLSELAYHYWLAGDREPALQYAISAGRFAQSVYANEEAIEHFEHALALLSPEPSVLRTQISEHLADAHFLSGHYDRTRQLLSEVAAATTATTDRVRIQRKLADVIGYSAGTPGEAADTLWSAAQLLGARRPASRGLYLADTAAALGRHFLGRWWRRSHSVTPDGEQRRLAELTTVYLRLGYFSFFSDPLMIFLPIFRAANVADRIRESHEHCHAYSMLAVALGALGLTQQAVRTGERALDEARRLHSPWTLANAHSFLGMAQLQAGDWHNALENATRARDGFAACGDHLELAISAYHIIETMHSLGDVHAARVRGRQELEVFERLGLQIIGKGVYISVGRVLAKGGDEQGLAMCRGALELATRGRDLLSQALAHQAIGEGCLQLGHIGDAIEHLERALTIRNDHGFDMYMNAAGCSLLAQAYAAQWRANGESFTQMEARGFERAVAQAKAAGRRFAPMRGPGALATGLYHRVRGRRDRAVKMFEQAAECAGRLRARFWEADARFELGLALPAAEGGHAALEQALGLYRSCGASPAEQRVMDALAGVRS